MIDISLVRTLTGAVAGNNCPPTELAIDDATRSAAMRQSVLALELVAIGKLFLPIVSDLIQLVHLLQLEPIENVHRLMNTKKRQTRDKQT